MRMAFRLRTHARLDTRKSQAVFIRKSNDAYLRHGVQLEWHPSGEKASLVTYVNGYRQGYSFLWYDNGKLKSLEHYTDGIRDSQSKYWDENGNLIACFMGDAEDCLRPSIFPPAALPGEMSFARSRSTLERRSGPEKGLDR